MNERAVLFNGLSGFFALNHQILLSELIRVVSLPPTRNLVFDVYEQYSG
jgi:hypothetical protein